MRDIMHLRFKIIIKYLTIKKLNRFSLLVYIQGHLSLEKTNIIIIPDPFPGA